MPKLRWNSLKVLPVQFPKRSRLSTASAVLRTFWFQLILGPTSADRPVYVHPLSRTVRYCPAKEVVKSNQPAAMTVISFTVPIAKGVGCPVIVYA